MAAVTQVRILVTAFFVTVRFFCKPGTKHTCMMTPLELFLLRSHSSDVSFKRLAPSALGDIAQW